MNNKLAQLYVKIEWTFAGIAILFIILLEFIKPISITFYWISFIMITISILGGVTTRIIRKKRLKIK